MPSESILATSVGETLSDWGEFRLIDEIVLPTFAAGPQTVPVGDDCTFVPVLEGTRLLAVTADAGPRPLVWNLGHQSYWTWGWYSVAISASDIAAAGAVPVAFANSVEAPSAMLVSDFRDFFQGIAGACAEFGFLNAGGNIREAPRFECHGTAIGRVVQGRRLTRRGCTSGDHLVAIGECGQFITAYLRAKIEGLSALTNPERDRLLRPRPPTHAMPKLLATGAITSGTDNSDGMLGSLWNIIERSGCAVELNLNDDQIPHAVQEVAAKVGADPWNLMFCWGDWQVICSVAKDHADRFWDAVGSLGVAARHLGCAVDGPPAIYGIRGSHRVTLNVIRNENFTSASFNRGSEAQLAHMLHASVFGDRVDKE